MKTASGTWDWMRRWTRWLMGAGVDGTAAANRGEQVQLFAGRTVSYKPRGRPRRLEVLSGRIWLTRHNDPMDHVLGPGDAVAMRSGDGTVVIEALRTAEFVIAVD